MRQINVYLKEMKIVNSHIDIIRTLPQKLELRTECRVNIKTPRNKAENSTLLSMELKVYTPGTDDMNIRLESDAFFISDQMPEDYMIEIEKTCVPIAQTELFDRLDTLLEVMGYKKLGLKERYEL